MRIKFYSVSYTVEDKAFYYAFADKALRNTKFLSLFVGADMSRADRMKFRTGRLSAEYMIANHAYRGSNLKIGQGEFEISCWLIIWNLIKSFRFGFSSK